MAVKRVDKSATLKRNPCIWEQAGVGTWDDCVEDYQCGRCDHDREMSRIAAENSRLRSEGKKPAGRNKDIVSWREKLRELPAGKRPCQHYLKQQIEHRMCTNDYNCANCGFDQYFYDQFAVHAIIKPIDVLDIEGLKVPQGYYFHSGHTWVRLEENAEVRIGLDDFAYHLLGPPDRIEVPLIGKRVGGGEADIRFFRGNHEARLKVPVSGVVTAINATLREDAVSAYRNPYTDGWLMRIHVPDLRGNLKQLMIGEEVREVLNRQVEELLQLIERDVQPLAADGGQLQRDVFGNLPAIGWDRLVETFFQ